MAIKSKNCRLDMGHINKVIVSRDLAARLGFKVMRSVGALPEMDTVIYRTPRKHPRSQAGMYSLA